MAAARSRLCPRWPGLFLLLLLCASTQTHASTAPTGQPTRQPSRQPTRQPTSNPTNPTGQPSSSPSYSPTGQPTSQPSIPTGQPTGQPSSVPSVEPSPSPTLPPTEPPNLAPPIIVPGVPAANRTFGYEVDVYWEFNTQGDLAGWGNATAEQMQMELTVVNGELRASIQGKRPNLDSPQLFITVTDRHYTIIRMMYFGDSPGARLLMRSGSGPTGRGSNDHSLADWAGPQPVQAIAASPSANASMYSPQKSVDGDQYSYYLSAASAGVFIVYDLGTSQWIREVKILPSGDNNTPRRCLLQASTTKDEGPFKTVAEFSFGDPLTGVFTDFVSIPVAGSPPKPTRFPTFPPQRGPDRNNQKVPTAGLINTPTGQPTRVPTGQPTRQPSAQPSRQPTRRPSGQPTRRPSSRPTGHPTPHGMGPHLPTNYTQYTGPPATTRNIQELTVAAFDANARFWRLLILDNYGGPGVGIREISFLGYTEEISVSPFAVDNTGMYKNYYIPLFPYVAGSLLRMRLELLPALTQANVASMSLSILTAALKARLNIQATNQQDIVVRACAALGVKRTGNSQADAAAAYIAMEGGIPDRGSKYRNAMSIDYIRIAKAPDVHRVLGCLDKYFLTASRTDQAQYNVTTHQKRINGNLPLNYFIKNAMSLPYADTYDCPLSGGALITVQGLYFGPKALVIIAGKECAKQSYATDGVIETITCITPPGQPGQQTLRVQNGNLPGLFQDVPYYSYRNAPPVQLSPIVTNVGAYRVDLVWAPPATTPLDHMMTTGYKILWFQPKFPFRVSNLTVGNVTTTSVRGLQPGTEYIFSVAPMAEGAFLEKSATLETDLYGRRAPADGALIGTFSPYTNVSATLNFDLNFGLFNANATLNVSAAVNSASLGPTGVWGGEGAYGLVFIGSANLQNCNVSSTCCDGYNATIGLASCGLLPSVCAVLPSRMLNSPYVINGITRMQTGTNLPFPDGSPSMIAIFTLEQLQQNKGANLPTASCGPALRLTDSDARQSGATWYGRKVNVREGFDTTITFEISQPSQKCTIMDDINTFCRSRGADGFAFVIQNVGLTALGTAGSGLGYEGIFNSLAVEIDTFHNYDNMDYFENHVAVMTQGWRYNISANHSRALATTNRVPDLTDGRHTIRIRYDPNFDETSIAHPSFQSGGYTTWFLENADFVYGGEGDWGVGFGLLTIYMDDMYSPIITTPLNLEKTLKLDDGRAYIGLTAATGDKNWQNHDILGWQFSSLHIDDDYVAPTIVNGEGAFSCVNESVCVNQVDYEHYMRKNNVYDDTRPYVGLNITATLSNQGVPTAISWVDLN